MRLTLLRKFGTIATAAAMISSLSATPMLARSYDDHSSSSYSRSSGGGYGFFPCDFGDLWSYLMNMHMPFGGHENSYAGSHDSGRYDDDRDSWNNDDDDDWNDDNDRYGRYDDNDDGNDWNDDDNDYGWNGGGSNQNANVRSSANTSVNSTINASAGNYTNISQH